jgi:tripartite motif-containing protein 2/3
MSDLSKGNLGNHIHFSNGLAHGFSNFASFTHDERQHVRYHRSAFGADAVGVDSASKFGGSLLSKNFDVFGSNAPQSLDHSLINRSLHCGSFDNWTNASSFSPLAANSSAVNCLGSSGLVVAARPVQSEPLLDLTAKMSFQNGHASSGAADNIFPPKLQVKRQKMIYHCKFGEFGIMEGQFTEPSGVAVNAQNDIIVADTNNHRIQIFDKDGRFKFQFGECGKKDGQLLYPNRVAVVKQSGDIVVTERSPTHQVR